jgi:glycine/serine hydroxymethyltransferase
MVFFLCNFARKTGRIMTMTLDLGKYLSAIKQDEQRNDRLLHLTANEPFMSETVRAALSLRIGERYYFGGGDDEGVVDFQPSTYLGLGGVQSLVDAATDAAKKMLGAAEINLNCLSGVHAMMCAILATTKPGDVVMTVGLEHGGHFSTKPVLENMGRRHVAAAYNVATLSFDVEETAKRYKYSNAKAFYMDVSFYLNPHNLRAIRSALGDEAIIIYDASHTLGLIMAGQFQAPFDEGANVICANTHKTLPGPQKGIIAFRDEQYGKKANGIINGGLFSSPHTASLVALSLAILEAREFGQEYAKQIINNSNTLGGVLAEHGYTVRKSNTGRYSENHQVHLITENIGEYRFLYRKLFSNSISVNFSNTLGGAMLIRLGTQEITRRGMYEAEMKSIATFIHKSLVGETIQKEVEAFTQRFHQAHYSFD